MNTVVALYNGTSFPTETTQTAMHRAKEAGAVARFLFISSDQLPGEGYIFPSDLDAAETGDDGKDAVKENDRIIEGSIQLVKDMCKAENIQCEIERLKNPTEADFESNLACADHIIFREQDDQPSYGAKSFNIATILEKHEAKIEWV